MLVKKVKLTRTGYGLPTVEAETNEKLNVHLINKTFDAYNQTFKFNSIKHVRGNVFGIENDLGMYEHNMFFKPKWYQYHKLGMYYVTRIIPELVSMFK